MEPKIRPMEGFPCPIESKIQPMGPSRSPGEAKSPDGRVQPASGLIESGVSDFHDL